MIRQFTGWTVRTFALCTGCLRTIRAGETAYNENAGECRDYCGRCHAGITEGR